jgi:hypothetical protein
MKQAVIAAVVALILGLAIGWFAGRSLLEREWSNPVVVLEGKDIRKASVDGGDPIPAIGTRLVRPVPLRRARTAAASLFAADAVKAKVVSFGNGDDGAELHVVLENRAGCTLSEVSGVAYAYDAWGRPARANKGGENYVAFAATKLAIADGSATESISEPLKSPELASIGFGQIDAWTCKEGKSWKRTL